MPEVSIIIPSFNRCIYISETLQSVIAQSFKNWECIIVDDGSTDNTIDIVKKFCENDSRFKLIHRPQKRPKGANTCRNIGIQSSKGFFVNFLDSDDILYPQKIEIQLNLFNSNEIDFCVCQTEFFGSIDSTNKLWNENLLSTDKINSFIQKKIGWSTNAPLWKKSALEALGPFDERLQNGQDFEFHIRALIKGLNYLAIDNILVKNRIHKFQIRSQNQKWKSKSLIFLSLKANYKSKAISNESLKFINEELVECAKMCFKEKKIFSGILIMTKSEYLGLNNIERYLRVLFWGIVLNITNRGYKRLSKI